MGLRGLDLGQPFWVLLTSHCWPSQLGLHSWAYKAIPLPQGGVSSSPTPPSDRGMGTRIQEASLTTPLLRVKGHYSLTRTNRLRLGSSLSLGRDPLS